VKETVELTGNIPGDWSDFVGHVVQLTYDDQVVGYGEVVDAQGNIKCHAHDREVWEEIRGPIVGYSVSQ
jgi:hypothetical protein